jgi:RIP metalloprotease RseP
LSFILGALKIIILIGFLVLIHEGGHFFVAKKCNVKVLEFSIGFGKELFSKQGKETKYTIRLIPLGGYCRMLGEEEAVDDERAFNKASIGKRLLIVFAGAFVNITFGLITFYILASIYNKSMYDGLIVTKRYIVSIGQSLIVLFKGKAQESVVGPVGISQMIVKTSRII